MTTPIHFEHTSDSGERVVSGVLIMSQLDWDRSPHSRSPLWQAFIRGDTVLAVAVGVVDPGPALDAWFNSKFRLSKSIPRRKSKPKK